MGSALLCGADDIRQLCAVQPAGRHLGGRLQLRGKMAAKIDPAQSVLTFFFFQFQRNERREREQRELVKKLREENETINELIYDEVTRSCCSESTTTSESEHIRNRWHSAEDIRKVPKCNIMKQLLSQPGTAGQQQPGANSSRDCSCGDSDRSSRHTSDNSIDRHRNPKHLKRV